MLGMNRNIKMVKSEKPEKKETFIDKLPKLGSASQLLLLVGIFLILFIPMFIIYQQQPVKRDLLEHELSNLQTILAADMPTKQDELRAQIAATEADIEMAKESYPGCECHNIIDVLLMMADSSDIVITKTTTDMSDENEARSQYPVLTFEVYFTGQVPKFQNFILDLNDRFQTSVIKGVDFQIADKEGDEDIAILRIDVTCNKGD